MARWLLSATLSVATDQVVHFIDGTTARVDQVITCSGYRVALPFFEGSAIPSTDPRDWYKIHLLRMIPPSPSSASCARSLDPFRALQNFNLAT